VTGGLLYRDVDCRPAPADEDDQRLRARRLFCRLIEGFSTAPGITTVSLTLCNPKRRLIRLRRAGARSVAPWRQRRIYRSERQVRTLGRAEVRVGEDSFIWRVYAVGRDFYRQL
jgi:hypothetical protein